MNDRKIAIITDSASDISNDFAKQHNIKIIPLRIFFKDKIYLDRVQVKSEDIYNMLQNEELPKTSLPSSEDIISVLDKVKSEGFTDVLYIGLSSGLSGSYNFVKMIGEEYEGLNFYSFDSKALSAPQGILLKLAVKLIEEKNISIKKVLFKLKEARKKMQSSFVVKNIFYLAKGGRISKAQGAVGSLLKVCPVVKINDEGIYEVKHKSIGFARSIQLMLKDFEDDFKGLDVNVSIVHFMNERLAKTMVDKIQVFANIINVDILPVTASLAIHTGPGLIGISMSEA